MLSDELIYAINQGMGVLFTVALGAMFVLMVVLWPRTKLHRAALVFMGSIFLATLRWCAATLRPDLFGARENLLASVFFAVATIATVWFAAASWIERVRNARDNP